jgi:hypothetical protein
MRSIHKTLVFVGIVVLLRVNLPPDDVAQSLEVPGSGGALESLAGKFLASEFIADWEYTDLLIVKIAVSERLGSTAVGLPFLKWHIVELEGKGK